MTPRRLAALNVNDIETYLPVITFLHAYIHPCQIFEVGSSTRIRDLIQSIAAQLNLLSADGFSIFLKTPDKVSHKDIFFIHNFTKATNIE